MSVVKEIIDCIESIGEKCYMPDYHNGECVERYVVVKLDGTADIIGISSERPVYMIMLYVPKKCYSQLEDFAFVVKNVLKSLYPKIEYLGNETPSYYDENVKGHMISFQYQGIRKIKKMKGV